MKATLPWATTPAFPVMDFLSLLKERIGAWQKDARCTTPSEDPDWFTFERTSSQRYSDGLTIAEIRAKRCCAICPVRKECLTDGMGEPAGIWGGTLQTERNRYFLLPIEVQVEMLLEDMSDEAAIHGWIAEEEVA